MNSLNDQRKIYDLFCNNGYEKSFDDFKTEMEDFLHSEDSLKIINNNFDELSDEILELVAGGFNIKLTAKVGIATLMSAFTLAASVGPASATTITPNQSQASVAVESDYNYNNQQLIDGLFYGKQQNNRSTDRKQQNNASADNKQQQVDASVENRQQQSNKSVDSKQQQSNKSKGKKQQKSSKSKSKKQQNNRSAVSNQKQSNVYVDNKQQQSKEAVDNKQQQSKEAVDNKQQQSKEVVDNKQQQSKEAVDNKQQQSKESVDNKQQQSKESVDNKQQQSKESVDNKQQQSKEAVDNEQQQSKEAVDNKQQQSKEAVDNKQQQSKEAVDNKQQQSKEAVDNKQQQSKEAVDNKQQQSNESVDNKQEQGNASVDNKQQQSKEIVDNKQQQLSKESIDFKIKSSDGTIGTAIKSGGKQDSILPLVYNDNYFSGSSTQYNKSLAAASLALELAGFADHSELGKEYTNQNKNAEDALRKLEFGDIKSNEEYNRKPDKDSIGVMTAYKETKVNGEDVAIIPVIIRGGGYELEWFSNTNVGTTGDKSNHKGFESAADLAKSHLKSYLSSMKNKIGNKKIKLWLVGYSRGGATAGMLTKSIDDDIKKNKNIGGFKLNHDDIYCYAFEAPRGLNENATFDYESEYDNIQNVVNSKDIVTHVAPKQWGFVRPGQEYRLDGEEGQDYNEGIRKILNGFLINSNSDDAHVSDSKEGNDKIFKELGGIKGYSSKVVSSLDKAVSKMREFVKKGKIKMPGNINSNRDFYSKILQKPIGKIISLYMGNAEFKDELTKEMDKPLISHSNNILDSLKDLADWKDGKYSMSSYGRVDVNKKVLFFNSKKTNYFYSVKDYIKFCGTAKSVDGHTERKAARALCLTINRVIDRLIEKHSSEPEYKKYLEECKMNLIKEYKEVDSSSANKYKELFSQLKCVERVKDNRGSEKITDYAQGKTDEELKKDLEIFQQVNARGSRGYYVKGAWFNGGYLDYVDNGTVVDEAVIADFVRNLFQALYDNSSSFMEYAKTADYIAMSGAMHTPELHLAQLINEDAGNTDLYQGLNNLIKSRHDKKWTHASNEVQNMNEEGFEYYLRSDKQDTNWQKIDLNQLSDYHK